MVWAALTIILMQGVLAVIALVVIRSFGAFSSDFRAWTAAMVRMTTPYFSCPPGK